MVTVRKGAEKAELCVVSNLKASQCKRRDAVDVYKQMHHLQPSVKSTFCATCITVLPFSVHEFALCKYKSAHPYYGLPVLVVT